jgi:quercetin dioxygenase-like cupin family protein
MNFEAIIAGIREHKDPIQPPAEHCSWQPVVRSGASPTTAQTALNQAPVHYQHCDPRLGVDFQVHKLPFSSLQAIDPRLVRIPPGACNEKHRHAHESLFVVLEGEAEILIGSRKVTLMCGGIAHVPRWLVHQSRNISQQQDLLLLAITDFGLTSSVLGDYDSRTRLRLGGVDAFASNQ